MDSCCRPRGNVCASGSDQRLRTGVSLFAIALVIGVVLAKTGLSPYWRLGLMVPFWFAAQGFFSALHKT